MTVLKVLFAAIGGWIAARLGGWDTLLAALVGLSLLDILTGLIKAVFKKSEKSKTGGVSSGAMWMGGLKKFLMLALVALAVVADDLISPDSSVIRGLVIGYYIATEALSVIENALQCGLPVPEKLKSVFEVMRSKSGAAIAASTKQNIETIAAPVAKEAENSAAATKTESEEKRE